MAIWVFKLTLQVLRKVKPGSKLFLRLGQVNGKLALIGSGPAGQIVFVVIMFAPASFIIVASLSLVVRHYKRESIIWGAEELAKSHPELISSSDTVSTKIINGEPLTTPDLVTLLIGPQREEVVREGGLKALFGEENVKEGRIQAFSEDTDLGAAGNVVVTESFIFTTGLLAAALVLPLGAAGVILTGNAPDPLGLITNIGIGITQVLS